MTSYLPVNTNYAQENHSRVCNVDLVVAAVVCSVCVCVYICVYVCIYTYVRVHLTAVSSFGAQATKLPEKIHDFCP